VSAVSFRRSTPFIRADVVLGRDNYDRLRTHLSLNKDAPLVRPVQSHGPMRRLPHFGGLHHSFVRM
jgi:hypothetical protein